MGFFFFLTKDEHTSTPPHPPSLEFTSGAFPGCCTLSGFGLMHPDGRTLLYFWQSNFTAQKIPVPSLTSKPWNYGSVYSLHCSTFSRVPYSWNHTVNSLSDWPLSLSKIHVFSWLTSLQQRRLFHRLDGYFTVRMDYCLFTVHLVKDTWLLPCFGNCLSVESLLFYFPTSIKPIIYENVEKAWCVFLTNAGCCCKQNLDLSSRLFPL